MIKILKHIYFFLRRCCLRLKFFFSINWLKTLYFNFRMLPFKQAKKLPFYFYGSVKFSSLKGKVKIEAPIKRGMVGFGQPYEMTTRSRGIAEIVLKGKFIVKGHIQFGKDYFLFIKEEACCTMGHMSSMASNAKLICTKEITFGAWTRIGSDSQVIDTNFHQMIDTVTLEKFPVSAPIILGSYNFISNRVTILSKTITLNYVTVASNSLCNKNYSEFGKNILIGGIPAKLIKREISRDWKGEKELMLKNLIVK